ncbi:MAG: hypothetical protein N2688_01805 [Burkholderiaceae bacterium]|nr:hypothetical protein [Burkholderiaceae bacterium]
MSCPTTRRYPRTLAEAFPAERACALERPAPRRWLDRAWAAAGWIGLTAIGVLLAWRG